MSEAALPQPRDVVLASLEKEPLRVIQVGLTPLPGADDAWFANLLVDLSSRPDLVSLFEAHKEAGEGDCTTSWFTAPEYKSRFCLLLSFTSPREAKAIVAFDLVRHGALADCFINGKGSIGLIAGEPGEHLEEIMPQVRPQILVEVVSAVDRQVWEALWMKSVEDAFDLEADAAARLVDLWQTEIRARATDPDLPPFREIAGVVRDKESKHLLIFSNQILINRLKRDLPAINESFDKYFWENIEELSAELGVLLTSVVPALLRAGRSDDQLLWSCSQLIGNALESISGAVELLRSGRRLQPGSLLRTSVEAAAMAIRLYQDPSQLGRFLAGKLDSAETVGKAKAFIPFIAQFWGHLSRDFAHIGRLYHRIQAAEAYESVDDAGAKTNLMAIHFTLIMVWTVAELIFYDDFAEHRYWSQQAPGQYALAIREDMRQRLANLEEKFRVESEETDSL